MTHSPTSDPSWWTRPMPTMRDILTVRVADRTEQVKPMEPYQRPEPIDCTCGAKVTVEKYEGGTCQKCGRAWRWEENYIDTQRWIPCSERMPESGVNVLMTYKAMGTATLVGCWKSQQTLPNAFHDTYPDGVWEFGSGICSPEFVTHWMPLPPPPEVKP